MSYGPKTTLHFLSYVKNAKIPTTSLYSQAIPFLSTANSH